MKIWLDVRNLSIEQKKFTMELVKYFSKTQKENTLNVYSNHDIEGVRLIKSKKFNGLLWEQFFFFKRLKEDKNDIVFTFNDNFPVLYKQKFVPIISSLEKLLYPNLELSQTLKKHSYQAILKANLKNAWKIVCFDEKTKKDINEKLNIDESKIEVFPCFFYKTEEKKLPEIQLSANIKQKHSIAGEYLIYDSETGSNKNLKRLLEAVAKTQVHLVFIGNKIWSDIELRELIMRLWVKEKIIFAWIPDGKEMDAYYQESLGVIYPSLYSSFPFYLNRAMNFQTKLYLSNQKELQDIFGKKAEYFSPISTLEITQTIQKALKDGKKQIDYEDIFTTYHPEKFTHNLNTLCQI